MQGGPLPADDADILLARRDDADRVADVASGPLPAATGTDPARRHSTRLPFEGADAVTSTVQRQTDTLGCTADAPRQHHTRTGISPRDRPPSTTGHRTGARAPRSARAVDRTPARPRSRPLSGP